MSVVFESDDQDGGFIVAIFVVSVDAQVSSNLSLKGQLAWKWIYFNSNMGGSKKIWAAIL
jgi:hypothetical protein